MQERKTERAPRSRLRAAVGFGALFVAAVLLWWVSRGPPDAVYDIPRNVRYTVTVKNPGNEYLAEVSFWVVAPVAETAYQRVESIEATAPYTIESDSLGNQRLLFTTDIAPYGTKHVTVDVQLGLTATPNWQDIGDSGRFLAAEPKIESDAGPIVSLAGNLTHESPSDTADSIYRWVSTNVEYAGYVRDDRGALYALNELRGDCTEYSYLYTALVRSAGIPARPVGGFVTPDNAVLRARDIHNWAEAYIDDRWRVVDPQNKVNRERGQHYVAMRLLGSGDGFSNTHQMIGADVTLEIRMN